MKIVLEEKMRVYFWRTGDKIIAQNSIGGMMGQLHEHSSEEWEKWRERNKDTVELIDLDRGDNC